MNLFQGQFSPSLSSSALGALGLRRTMTQCPPHRQRLCLQAPTNQSQKTMSGVNNSIQKSQDSIPLCSKEARTTREEPTPAGASESAEL